MRDVTATLSRLTALKALGLKLGVDDFGTGYSSLAYLRQFPIDILKLDQGFVSEIAEAAALVRTLVQLGKATRSHDACRGDRDGRAARTPSTSDRDSCSLARSTCQRWADSWSSSAQTSHREPEARRSSLYWCRTGWRPLETSFANAIFTRAGGMFLNSALRNGKQLHRHEPPSYGKRRSSPNPRR